MKKALIVLGLEVAVLAVVVLAYLASAGPGVRQPAVVPTVRPAPARTEVPVSITLSSVVGRVETAELARGGEAGAAGSHGSVSVKIRTTP